MCSEDERRAAVRRSINGESNNDIASDYNVSASTISLWRKQFLDEELKKLEELGGTKGNVARSYTRRKTKEKAVGSKEGEVHMLQKHPEREYLPPVTKKEEKRDFKTESMQVAALLHMTDRQVILIDGPEGHRSFHFEWDEDIQDLLDDYFSGKYTCSPHRFYGALYQVKRLIYPNNK